MTTKNTNHPFARAGVLAMLVAATALGCSGSLLSPEPPEVPGGPLDGVASSTKNELLWKRARALQNSLAQALSIPAEDVCNELDRFSCIDGVHQVALGGNDPFEQGQYEPLRAPSTTTALTFDRVVLSACSAAVELDAARPAPVVFRGHALTDDPLTDLDDAAIGADLLGTTLVQRVHGREPLAAELSVLRELLVDDDGVPVSGRTFAKLACFAVASTTENLFY
jgi:hypothetical protein